MWSYTIGLACLLALVPDQSEKLSLENVRLLHGVPGLPRSEAKFIHGDSFYLAFDIKGVKADDEGKVNYSLLTEVNFKGRLEFKHEAKNIEAIDSLGGGILPGFTQLNIGPDQPVGTYTVKVTAKDKKSNATATFSKDFELVKGDLGIVQVRTTADQAGTVPTSVFATGESLWLNFGVVGFQRGASKQPNLKISLEIFDSNGKKTVTKTPVAEVNKDVPAETSVFPVQFYVALNRSGKFTLKLKATDTISGKIASLDLPLEVIHAK
jgi:hypothetical protein